MNQPPRELPRELQDALAQLGAEYGLIAPLQRKLLMEKVHQRIRHFCQTAEGTVQARLLELLERLDNEPIGQSTVHNDLTYHEIFVSHVRMLIRDLPPPDRAQTEEELAIGKAQENSSIMSMLDWLEKDIQYATQEYENGAELSRALINVRTLKTVLTSNQQRPALGDHQLRFDIAYKGTDQIRREFGLSMSDAQVAELAVEYGLPYTAETFGALCKFARHIEHPAPEIPKGWALVPIDMPNEILAHARIMTRTDWNKLLENSPKYKVSDT